MSFDKDLEIKNNRKAIKPLWNDLRKIKTDRNLDKKRPELFKEIKDTEIIKLQKDFPNITQKSLTEVIKLRRSTRKYSDKPLTIEEVSYLIWETSRVDYVKNNAVFRSIPTGGATNGMETYIYLNNVEGYNGLYLYHQNKHELALIKDYEGLSKEVNEAIYRQLRGTGVVVFLTAVPKRSEYKYSFTAHKMLAMESGHAAQNLSLASEVIDSGACCLAAYDQELCDNLLNLDGIEEFTMYAITVGKRI